MISAIVPIHDCCDYTIRLIKSCVDNGMPDEIILVDNGSDYVNKKQLDRYLGELNYVGMRVITLPENKGFPIAVNVGLSHACGDTMVVLNNDLLMPPKWIDRMMYHLSWYDIVSTRASMCAGYQKLRLPPYKGVDGFYEAADKRGKEMLGRCTDVNWCIGFFMAFERYVLDTLKGFDENYGIGNSEDIDFCYRARTNGMNITVAEDIYVHHFGSITHNHIGLVGRAYYAHLDANNRKMFEKYSEEDVKDFYSHQVIGYNERKEMYGAV